MVQPEEADHKSFGDDQSEKSFKEVRACKPYLMRLKRHQDAVISLHSPDGIKGSLCVSGSADERCRIWDFKEKTISKSIPFDRPSDDRLMKYRAMGADSLPRFSQPGLAALQSRAGMETGKPAAINGEEIQDHLI